MGLTGGPTGKRAAEGDAESQGKEDQMNWPLFQKREEPGQKKKKPSSKEETTQTPRSPPKNSDAKN